MSMLADISGKKQIVVSEQREGFSDPSMKVFDPTKLDVDEQPLKKKAKLDEKSSKNSKLKKGVQDTNRFVKIDAGVNLTDLFGKNKVIDESAGAGGFNFGGNDDVKSKPSGFDFSANNDDRFGGLAGKKLD